MNCKVDTLKNCKILLKELKDNIKAQCNLHDKFSWLPCRNWQDSPDISMTLPPKMELKNIHFPISKLNAELCFPDGMVLYKDLLTGQQTELRIQMYVFAQESFPPLPRLFKREKLSFIKCIHM